MRALCESCGKPLSAWFVRYDQIRQRWFMWCYAAWRAVSRFESRLSAEGRGDG